MKGLVNHDKEPGFYHEDSGKALKGLKQDSDIIRLVPLADHSGGREDGGLNGEARLKTPRPLRKELVLVFILV